MTLSDRESFASRIVSTSPSSSHVRAQSASRPPYASCPSDDDDDDDDDDDPLMSGGALPPQSPRSATGEALRKYVLPAATLLLFLLLLLLLPPPVAESSPASPPASPPPPEAALSSAMSAGSCQRGAEPAAGDGRSASAHWPFAPLVSAASQQGTVCSAPKEGFSRDSVRPSGLMPLLPPPSASAPLAPHSWAKEKKLSK